MYHTFGISATNPLPATTIAANTAERLGMVRTTQPASLVKTVGPLANSAGHLLVTAGGCVVSVMYVSSLASGVLNNRSNGSSTSSPYHHSFRQCHSGRLSSGGVEGSVNEKGANHIVEILDHPNVDATLHRLGSVNGEPPTLGSLASGYLGSALREEVLLGATNIATAAGAGSTTATAASTSIAPFAVMRLTTGLVASLDVAPLPTGNTALGVVGTTRGTLCAFLIHYDGLALVKLCETELATLLAGSASSRVATAGSYSTSAVAAMVSPEDTIRDIALSMDPAGRPEAVLCATATCVAVVDALDLSPGDTPSGNGGDTTAVAAATATMAYDDEEGRKNDTHPSVASSATEAGVGAAVAGVRADRRGHQRLRAHSHHGVLSPLQRDRSDPLCVVFANAEVVRVFAPQRHRAAFAADVAAVIVLADGVVRFVERIVTGGSVRLLLDHHQSRQQLSQGGGMVSERVRVGGGMDAAATAALSGEAMTQLANPQAIPHVVYAYRLAEATVNLARRTEGGATFHDRAITVNDAALFFNARVGHMDLVAAGTRQSCLATMQPSSKLTAAGAGAPSPSTDGGGEGVGGSTTRHAWWAVARGLVLPACTLDSLLSKEAYYSGRAAQTTRMTAGSSGPSPHTVHCQSGWGLLFRSGSGSCGGAGGPSGGAVAGGGGGVGSSGGVGGATMAATAAATVAAAGTAPAVAITSLAAVTTLSRQNDVVAIFVAGSDLFALSSLADADTEPTMTTAVATAADRAHAFDTEDGNPSTTWANNGNGNSTNRILSPPRHVLATEVTVEAISSLAEYRVGSSSAALMCVAAGSTLSIVGL